MKKILRSILVCAAMIITFSWNTNCVKAEDSIEIYNGVKYRVNNEQKWASVCGYSGDAEDLEIPFMVGRGIIVSQITAECRNNRHSAQKYIKKCLHYLNLIPYFYTDRIIHMNLVFPN